MTASALVDWFVREILPLEAALMHFLQQNWRNPHEIADLRQDVYVQVYDAARKQIPTHPKAFVFQTARNLLINRVRRDHVVSIEAVPDLETLSIAADLPSPEHAAIARDDLRRLRAALDRLPPRCREAVILGRIEGLPGRAIAVRMGVSDATVSEHLANGIRALVDEIYGHDVQRKGQP
ncbi:MAG TPA: sigma-70 family RNA polymerase sigma factor [Rhizomicrobium sp.]|nr:sigma-70 family RNA polymerase sigma factor [Rhizomicrobium sp.]